MPWVSVALLLGGCGGRDQGLAPDPDAVPVVMERLDQDLFRAQDMPIGALNLRLYATYGEFYRTYIEHILQMPPMEDPRLGPALVAFVGDPDWRAVQDAVDSVLGDMARERDQFSDAFARLRTAFPDSFVPRIVAFNSGYNYGIIPTDSVLGVGVEWFIGSDHPVIGHLAPDRFPQYMKDRMRPELLVPGALKGWLLVHYTRDIRGTDLLTQLVETGKVMALLDAMLPEMPSDLKLTFTPEQLDWCHAQELNIWKEIVEKEMLFSRDAKVIDRIMADGPFTPGFPRESPGHIGEWIGLRMVQAYRGEHPDLSFAELFAITDPHIFLRSYKPR